MYLSLSSVLAPLGIRLDDLVTSRTGSVVREGLVSRALSRQSTARPRVRSEQGGQGREKNVGTPSSSRSGAQPATPPAPPSVGRREEEVEVVLKKAVKHLLLLSNAPQGPQVGTAGVRERATFVSTFLDATLSRVREHCATHDLPLFERASIERTILDTVLEVLTKELEVECRQRGGFLAKVRGVLSRQFTPLLCHSSLSMRFLAPQVASEYSRSVSSLRDRLQGAEESNEDLRQQLEEEQGRRARVEGALREKEELLRQRVEMFEVRAKKV